MCIVFVLDSLVEILRGLKSKNMISTSIPLELLNLDLFGPSRTMSIGGDYYALVIMDDYSRFTWTLLLYLKKMLSKFFVN